MTSPQATTTEVIANMATTGIHDESLNLTAEIHRGAEVNAPTPPKQKELQETIPPVENKEMNVVEEEAKEDSKDEITTRPKEAATATPNNDGLPRFDDQNFVQEAGRVRSGQEIIRPEDAAIPQLNHDGLQNDFGFPDHQAALAAMVAMGQMGQIFDPNLAAFSQMGALGMPMLPMPNQDDIWANQEEPQLPEDRLVGYAKLVFEDGEFYMNTHSIKLGRDISAHKAAQRREKEEERLKREAEEKVKKGESSAPRTPVQIKREHISYSMSVYSEKSGILREGNDSDGETRSRRRHRKKMSKKSKSTGSSHDLSRRNSLAQPPPIPKAHIYEPQYPDRVKEEHAAPVDPNALRPDPNECPLIPLHPSGDAPAGAYKAISREHVKIAYNLTKAIFEMHIYGRNGAFVDDVYHPMNTVVELKSGNVLQIGQVPLEFVLPDGIIAEGNEMYSTGTGGKEMSYDFEDVTRDGVTEDSSPEPVSDDGEAIQDEDDEGEELGQPIEESEEEEEEEEDEDEDQEEAEVSDQHDYGLLEAGQEEQVVEAGQEIVVQPGAVPGKKRGPGRPPKDGIMSQREKQLAKKAALESQKAGKTITLPASTPTSGKEKKPVGRPRKHERPDPTEPEKPKRKYTKRKPKEPKEGDAKEGDEAEETIKEKKEKKVKPPRSPSPTFDINTLTPEELQKPTANYVTLIYEALSNSKEGKLGLPQIYRAIQRKYPYFVCKVETLGWQSSVRHNLSQHHAFKKCERDGKGWLWGIEPGVSIEKEKRRKTPPPSPMGGHMHQPLYPGQQPYMGPPGPHPYPPPHIMGHPGYGPPPHMMPGGAPRPGQPPHYIPPPHMNGHTPAHYPQPPSNPITPGFAASIAPQLVGNRSYSSPYASNPPPAPPAASITSEQKPSGEQQSSTSVPPTQVSTQAPTDSASTNENPPSNQQPPPPDQQQLNSNQNPPPTQNPQSQPVQGQQQPQQQTPTSQPSQGQTPIQNQSPQVQSQPRSQPPPNHPPQSQPAQVQQLPPHQTPPQYNPSQAAQGQPPTNYTPQRQPIHSQHQSQSQGPPSYNPSQPAQGQQQPLSRQGPPNYTTSKPAQGQPQFQSQATPSYPPQSHTSQGTQQPQNLFQQIPLPQSQLQPQSQPQQGLLESPTPKSPPTAVPTVPERPQYGPKLIASVETFKKRLIANMLPKDVKGEEIVNSAVNQVLGYSTESTLPGNAFEDGIKINLRKFLEALNYTLINGSPIPENAPPTNQNQPQATAAATTNQQQQPPKSTCSEKPPTVMRPTFTGQGMSRPSFSRPQMGTPTGMKASPGNASPTRQGSEGGQAQVVGQKRPLDDADENRDAKRLNGSGTPQTPQVKV